MLTYYFEGLNSRAYDKVNNESFDTIFELLTELLLIGTKQQVKKGFHRGYKQQEETSSTVRGSIQVFKSVREGALLNKKVAIQYDEYSPDIIYNQIIKTTLMQLLRNKHDVREEQHYEIRSLLPYFSDISTVTLTNIKWQEMVFHRNNKRYELLMNICKFIIEELLMREETGASLQEIFEKENLNILYEKFLLNYYKKHHSSSYKVYSPHIKWAIKKDTFSLKLPQMVTDVVLENEHKVIILDAKFYKEGAFTSKMGTTFTHRSNNLYQMYAYMNNWEQTRPGKTVSGILAYAQPDDNSVVTDSYIISDKTLNIITLNMNQEWEHIKNSLDEAIK